MKKSGSQIERRKKARPLHKARQEFLRTPANRSRELLRLRGEMPRRLRKTIGYHYFSPATHVERLKLDSKFFASLTGKSSVLEIGAGTGRLADYLLKHSRLKPENLDLMDRQYDKHPPWLKKRIKALVDEGRLKLIEGDMYEFPFKKRYDHILIPEAFFNLASNVSPEFGKAHERVSRAAKKEGWFVEDRLENTEAFEWFLDAVQTRILVERLEASVKAGGSIRISWFDDQTVKWMLKHPQIFPGFKASTGAKGNGLILEKKKAR